MRENGIPCVSIRLPVAELEPTRYMTDRLDLRLNHQQQCGLRRLFDGLDQDGARLASGKRVASPADVIRFLLEGVEAQASQVHEAAESAAAAEKPRAGHRRTPGARTIRTAGASDRSDS